VFYSSCVNRDSRLQNRSHLADWHWLAVVSLGVRVGNGRLVVTHHDEASGPELFVCNLTTATSSLDGVDASATMKRMLGKSMLFSKASHEGKSLMKSVCLVQKLRFVARRTPQSPFDTDSNNGDRGKDTRIRHRRPMQLASVPVQDRSRQATAAATATI